MRYLILLAICFSTSSFSASYTTLYGEWRGQAQYQAFVNTTSDPAAHLITNLIVSVDPQGKVIGGSLENGCQLLGLAAPGIAPAIVTLDVTVTNCKYAGLNRTYRGMLSVNDKDKFATLSLQAVQIAAGKAGTFNITSTMRR